MLPFNILEIPAQLVNLVTTSLQQEAKRVYQQKGTFSKQASIPSNALLASYKVAL